MNSSRTATNRKVAANCGVGKNSEELYKRSRFIFMCSGQRVNAEAFLGHSDGVKFS